MRVDEESLEMSLEMCLQSAWEADRSISKRRKWSSGAR